MALFSRARTRPAMPGGMFGPITGPDMGRTPAFGRTSRPGTTPTFDEAWFRGIIGDRPANSDTLGSLMDEFGKYGVKVLQNAEGIYGKLELPDGRIIDVGRAFSSGNPGAMSWQWLDDGGANARRQRGEGVDPTGTAVQRPDLLGSFSTDYSAAVNAARRQRMMSGAGGRRSTILGGFKASGRPSTRPAVAGGY